MAFQETQSLLNKYTRMMVFIPVIILLVTIFPQKHSVAIWFICGFAILLTFAVCLMVFTSRLTIAEDADGLRLHARCIFTQQVFLSWKEIDAVTLKKISPVLNFGGWGIRYTGKITGYIFQGNNGVFVKTKSGRVYAFTIVNKESFRQMVSETKGLPVTVNN